MSRSEIVSFLSSVADLMRDAFKRGKYRDVISPLTFPRRPDGILSGTKQEVLQAHERIEGKLENLDPQLRAASGFAF
jgi:type I restriction enzyme M protein